MEFRQLLAKRRMVHRFAPDPVPEAVLLDVLEVARHAPSAGFSQGFDFVALQEPAQRDWFWRTTEHPVFPYSTQDVVDRPPCIVLAVANRPAYLRRYSLPDKAPYGLQTAAAWPVPYWDVDTGMAVMLVLLAAVEAGLGAWFFGITWGEAELCSTLGVPEGCRPIGAIGLGFPIADPRRRGSAFSRRRRSLDSMVHLGRWHADGAEGGDG